MLHRAGVDVDESGVAAFEAGLDQQVVPGAYHCVAEQQSAAVEVDARPAQTVDLAPAAADDETHPEVERQGRVLGGRRYEQLGERPGRGGAGWTAALCRALGVDGR